MDKNSFFKLAERIQKSGKKPKQEEFSFSSGKKPKSEKDLSVAELVWGPKFFSTSDMSSDRFGEKGDVEIKFDKGEWTIDHKPVDFKDMEKAIGPAWQGLIEKDGVFREIIRREKTSAEDL